MMQKLDEALVELRQDMRDYKKQCAFYDLFLNSSFFVPILEDSGNQEQENVLPVITEAEGKDYLMIFSTLERLQAWDAQKPRYVEVPGHVLALSTTPPLHWALNVGTEFSKQFHPEEIAWLRDSVERCNAEAAKAQGA